MKEENKAPSQEPVKLDYTVSTTAPTVTAPRPNNVKIFCGAGTDVLTVTAEGEFIWHPDADRLIEEGDFSASPALPFILKRLRKSESMLGLRDRAIWNEAIEAAANKVGKVLREDGRWQADVIRELKK